MADEHANQQTKIIERDLEKLNSRFDRHLEIYATNGKELASLRTSVESLRNLIQSESNQTNNQEIRIRSIETGMEKLKTQVGLYAALGSSAAGIAVQLAFIFL